MKHSLGKALFGLLLSALVFQACSNSTSVEPPKEGKLVFGGSSVIDLGRVAVAGGKDTNLRITNTGNADLIISSTGNTAAVSSSLHIGDTIVSGGYKDVIFHVVPADTGVQIVGDTITYTTGGKSLPLVMTFKATGYRDLPGPGSSYTFAVVDIDTSGVTTQQPDQTLTVTSNSESYAGKDNVVAVEDDYGDVSYFHKESNGDLSAYLDLGSMSQGLVGSRWFTIPLGSKHDIVDTILTLKNQAFPYNGATINVDITMIATSSYTGPDDVTGAGSTFHTQTGQIKITTSVAPTAFGGLIKISRYDTGKLWYSDALTFFAKRTTVSQDFASTKKSNETWTIKSYSIK